MKAFKYRIYPKKNQVNQFDIMFKAKRYIWNHFLEVNMNRFEAKEGILSYSSMSSMLTELKHEEKWLYDCEKSVLQNTLRDLSEAYKRFLKGTMKYSKKTIEHANRVGKELGIYDLEKHPKFKSYKNRNQSIRMNLTNKNIEIIEKDIEYTSSGKYKKQNCKVKLPKVKFVKIAYSRRYDGRLLNAIVSKDADGKYYIALCCTDIIEKELDETGKKVGLDLGIKVFATQSDGYKIANPKYYEKYQNKLVKLQREYSRRQKGGMNRKKTRLKLSRCHKKIRNCRRDFLHKTTSELVKTYDIICLEDLKIKKMQENRKYSRVVSDASFYEFRTLLSYKMTRHKKLIIINQYYASSQICNNCCYQNKTIKDIRIRNWKCPICGESHERDLNASKNILREGLKEII